MEINLNEKLQKAKLSNGNTREALTKRLPIPGPGRKKLTPEQKLIKRAAKEKINHFLEQNGLGAASRIVKLSKIAKNENIMLNANQDILDRIGVGTANKNTIVPIQINFSDNDLQ